MKHRAVSVVRSLGVWAPLSAASLVLALSSNSQTANVTTGKAPSILRSAGLYSNIEYGVAGSGRLLLDAFVPERPGPFPVALMVHGGGWGGGDKAKDITPVLEALTKAGFTWFSINYRLAPTNRWPACFEDVQTAIRWAKAHAAEFKGDPKHIALIGYSAGGQLACQAAVLASEDTRVQAVVGLAAPTDLVKDTERRGGLSKSLQALLDRTNVDDSVTATLEALSPINHLKAGLPPFLLIHGTGDKTVPLQQSLDFQKRLLELGVSCEVITLPGAPHNIKDWAKSDAAYTGKVTAWLERNLGPGTAEAARDSGARGDARPPGEPQPQAIKPDIVVAADGTGNFRTVQQALASLPHDNHQRLVVLVRDGVYKEKVRIDAADVTLRGQSRHRTRIEFAQLNDDFTKHPDDLGRAVVNINADDFVLENLTVANTAGVVGPHSFAVFGKADRVVLEDCDLLSEGADTVSLWKAESGRYYHARCNFRGAVDFVCPRGWCYITDSTFYETKATAAVWHDGLADREMKFVLRNCRFDGVEGYNLARHHHDAQFYFLDCAFSQTMVDRAPFRVIYPLDGSPPGTNDLHRNQELDKSNIWGERAYYYNCHRQDGDYPWHKDNLASAPGAPTPAQITAAWTFAKKWDPERHDGPVILQAAAREGRIEVVFSESVTVKGKPRLLLKSGRSAEYAGGSGSTTLAFALPPGDPGIGAQLDSNGGAIIATEATAALLAARLSLP